MDTWYFSKRKRPAISSGDHWCWMNLSLTRASKSGLSSFFAGRHFLRRSQQCLCAIAGIYKASLPLRCSSLEIIALDRPNSLAMTESFLPYLLLHLNCEFKRQKLETTDGSTKCGSSITSDMSASYLSAVSWSRRIVTLGSHKLITKTAPEIA